MNLLKKTAAAIEGDPKQKLIDAVDKLESQDVKNTPDDWSDKVTKAINDSQEKFDEYIFYINFPFSTKGSKKLSTQLKDAFRRELAKIRKNLEKAPQVNIDQVIEDILDGFDREKRLGDLEKSHWENNSSAFEIAENFDVLSKLDKNWSLEMIKKARTENIHSVFAGIDKISAVSKKLGKEILQEKFEYDKDEFWYIFFTIDWSATSKLSADVACPTLEKAIWHLYDQPLKILEKEAELRKIGGDEWTGKVLTRAKRQKGMIGTAREINELHESPDNVRYKSIENFNADDLYDLIVFAREEIFTSSYNTVVDQLLNELKTKKEDASDLIQKGENPEWIGVFLEAASSYNRIDDLLDTIKSSEKKEALLKNFIESIKKNNELKNAVVLSELTLAIRNKSVANFLEREIIKAYNDDDKKQKTLFGLVAKNYFDNRKNVVQNTDWFEELPEKYKLPNLDLISSKELFDSAGRNIQQYFFYNDKDGKASFNSFISKYKNSEWKIEDKGSFVIITGKKQGKTIKIYANKAECDGSVEKDGVKDIENSMRKTQPPLESIVIVHRGHSYHTDKTIENIPKIAKMVFLGSCGGYQNFEKILEKSPEAHIIASKGEGTKFINDPIFRFINENILSGRDINWNSIWEKLGQEKSGHPKYKNVVDDPRFKDYINPSKNYGALFIKAYRKLSHLY